MLSNKKTERRCDRAFWDETARRLTTTREGAVTHGRAVPRREEERVTRGAEKTDDILVHTTQKRLKPTMRGETSRTGGQQVAPRGERWENLGTF